MRTPEPVLRINNEVLYTPIQEFKHRSTDSTIDLVGTCHIAEPSYFNAVNAFAESREREGATVHYERIQLYVPNGQESETSDEALHFGMSRIGVQVLQARGTDLAFQHEVLRYPKSWENHDATIVAIAKALGPDVVREQIDVASTMSVEIGLRSKHENRAYHNAAIRRMAEIDATEDFDVVQDALLTMRNKIAVSAVSAQHKQDPEQDFVLLWGASHIPGIGEGLSELGYGQTANTRWLPALSVK